MKRVVVTGIGVVSPLGNSAEEFWQNIINGESGIGAISRVETKHHLTRYAAEVKDIDKHPHLERKFAKRADLYTQFAMAASLEAYEHSGLTEDSYPPERRAIVMGTGIGGITTIENACFGYARKEDEREAKSETDTIHIPPLTIPKYISNIAGAHIAIALNFQGPCYALTTACSSGTDAIGNAYRHIKEGLADVIIAGGVEAVVNHMGVSGFNALHALSSGYADNPKRASRPFDKDRDGFVIGEGAGIVILEDAERAKQRGATIYAEILGNGMTCDAHHQTAPHPEGRGAARAMQMALDDAGIQAEDIDYINAHGTSTPINDPVETRAIKEVFKDHAYKLKVSSTKSMTGHCIGAAGGIEAIAGIFAIRDQIFPPTINLDEADPECDLDYVPNKMQRGKIRRVLSNTFGFGGHNGTLVIQGWED